MTSKPIVQPQPLPKAARVQAKTPQKKRRADGPIAIAFKSNSANPTPEKRDMVDIRNIMVKTKADGDDRPEQEKEESPGASP